VSARKPVGPIGWSQRRGSGIPTPESAARKTAIRTFALVTLAVTAMYLAWRAAATIELSAWWLAIPLFVLEVHAALGLALFTFSLWDVDRRPPVSDVSSMPGRIAVLVPTYNEGIEILTPTVAAAVAMRLPHTTWVLDDGARLEVRRLATELGAHYLARSEHAHAKAGNLNHALGVIDADFIAVLDADHVASPDFLVRTLGYFADPRVALVQTPQDFYNDDSFEHESSDDGDRDRDRLHEQALFYRVLQPGKNRWQAAFWCGTGAVVRVIALRSVGGVATDTITEDIHTTIRLHRKGWRTVYHNEVLARGLAASDAATYQSQRLRWGTGAMQVLRKENPLFVSGLTFRQRLAYAATLLGWFDAIRTLGYLLIPIVVVVTGASPIRASAEVFIPAFVITLGLQQMALRLLSRGYHRPIFSIVFELVRMTANIQAASTLLVPRRPKFNVTPKGRVGDGRRRLPAPLPLRLVLAGSAGAAIWFGATAAGLTGQRYAEPWAVYGAMFWLVVNALLVTAAYRRIHGARFAGERRSSVRFPVVTTGRLAGEPAEVDDISMTGARLTLAGMPRDGVLEIDLDGRTFAFSGTTRSLHPEADGCWTCGFEFAPEQFAERGRFALAIFTAAQFEIAAASPKPLGAVA
jgi:cellulose synthase (UDP-forming)